MQRFISVLAGIYGLLGVTGGAAAAHAVADPHAADMLRTAALYALLHGIFLLCWKAEDRLARPLLALGTLLFSGALAAKYLLGFAAAGILAPVGGTVLIAGWIAVVSRQFCRSSATCSARPE